MVYKQHTLVLVESTVPATMPTSSATAAQRLSPEQLNAFQARDSEAIERWIYGNRSFILGVLQRYSKNTEVAQDLLQETFFQAIRSAPRFRGSSKVTTWLYSIAKNVALQRGRTNDRYAHVEDNALNRMVSSTHGPAFGTDVSPSPARSTMHSEEKQLLYDALKELPNSYRQIIALRDLQELSTSEVAEELDITLGNARVRLHRARKRLRTVLAPRVDDTYRWVS